MRHILIRECKQFDMPNVSEIVRNAYISNIFNSWINVIFSEITFQLITLVSAYMFIFMNIPLYYCLISIPIVFTVLYVIIYGSVLIKSAELIHSKKPLQCWIAETIEPFNLPIKEKEDVRFVTETDSEYHNLSNARKKVIGTVAVMRHMKRHDWAWLTRLAVEKKYRRMGVALKLTKAVQEWCKINRFNNLELVITDCQEGARQLFGKAGFEVGQMYHQRLLTSAFTLQMYQLRYEVRSTFE